MKKLISLIIAVLLVLTSFTSIAADAYPAEENENSVSILTDLGIFDSSDFSAASEYLTRGEAARLLVKMTGVGVSASNPMPFTDVTEENINYEYIASAYALKYISGVSQTQFAPDEPITKSQTAKIIMSILGYDTLCVAAGGYPAGYLRYANDVDLFDGISLSESENVSPGEMSVIILNALKAELMIQTVFGDETQYNSYDGRNLLSENFDIYVQTAVIEADRYVSLYDKSGTDEDEVIADSVSYDSSQYDGKIPVGCRCELYYRQTSASSKRELLSVYAGSEDNSVYELSADSISSSSQSQLEYDDENGKSKRLSISSNAIFIYNGQLAGSTKKIFDDCDEVILIDNDKNGSCDVVFVNKYTVLQVKNLSKDDFTVYDKLSGQSHCFDNTSEFATVFYYNGEITDFYEIEKDSVLSVLIPQDTSEFFTKQVYVTDEYLDALVDEINQSQSEIVSDGTAYKITGDAMGTVKIGSKYRFRFDITGRIVSAESIESIKNYAYFTSIKTGGFDEVSIQLFTTEGKWLEVPLDKTIKFNGAKINSTDIFNKEALFTDGEPEGQLVEYTLNKDGFISSLATASDVTSIRFTDEENSYIDAEEFRLSFNSSSARFVNSSGTITFGEKAHLTADATVMIIPSEGNAKEEFLIATPDNLTTNVIYTGVKVYNCDEYALSSLAVIYDSAESYKGTTPMIVSRVTNVLNEDGDPVQRVYGYSRTTYEEQYDIAEYTSLESITPDGTLLKAGDLIIPVINADGKIVNFDRLHNAGTDTYGASSANIYTDYASVFGKVISAGPDYVVLDYGTDKASFRLYSTSVYVCEPSRDGLYSVRLGSVNDFQVEDDVTIRTYYLRGLVAVIYKD